MTLPASAGGGGGMGAVKGAPSLAPQTWQKRAPGSLSVAPHAEQAFSIFLVGSSMIAANKHSISHAVCGMSKCPWSFVLCPWSLVICSASLFLDKGQMTNDQGPCPAFFDMAV